MLRENSVLAKNIFEMCHLIHGKANSICVHYSTPSDSLKLG